MTKIAYDIPVINTAEDNVRDEIEELLYTLTELHIDQGLGFGDITIVLTNMKGKTQVVYVIVYSHLVSVLYDVQVSFPGQDGYILPNEGLNYTQTVDYIMEMTGK